MGFGTAMSRGLWATSAVGFAMLLSVSATCAGPGPFEGLGGVWTGRGTIQLEDGSTEKIRCKATYAVSGDAQGLNQTLLCASDSYKFDLVGQFDIDGSNQLSGRWSENSRNVGGTAIGNVKGDRMQIHVESSAFSATLVMITKGKQQKISFDAHGGGQVVDSSITLHR